MDPLDKICRLPYNPDAVISDPFLEIGLSFTGSTKINPKTPFKMLSHQTHHHEAVYCDTDRYALLRKIRKIYLHEDRDKYLTNLYPYENANNSIFMNRASLKLANIDLDFNLTGNNFGSLHKQLEGDFSFVDIAGGPGGFTQYLQYRRPESIGIGITMKAMIDWNINGLDTARFIPVYGDDQSGNLLTQYEFFHDVVKNQYPDGVDLAVADGGFEVSGEEKERQEFLTLRLLTVQVYLGIFTVKTGGHFVVKTFDTVTQMTATIVYLCALAFEEICLFKPIMSRSTNPEQYLICRKRRPTVSGEIKMLLKNIIEQTNGDNQVVDVGISLPEEFTKWLKTVNNKWIERQIVTGKTMIELISERQVSSPEAVYTADTHNLLIQLNLPGERHFKSKRRPAEIVS